MIDDIIAIAVIVLLVGGAVAYIIKAKRQGQKCIGCPDSKTCGSSGCCSGSCRDCNGGCAHSTENKNTEN